MFALTLDPDEENTKRLRLLDGVSSAFVGLGSGRVTQDEKKIIAKTSKHAEEEGVYKGDIREAEHRGIVLGRTFKS